MTQIQDSDQILDISFAYNSIVLYAVIKMSPVVSIMPFISPGLGSNIDPSTAFVQQSSHFTDKEIEAQRYEVTYQSKVSHTARKKVTLNSSLWVWGPLVWPEQEAGHLTSVLGFL